MKLPTLIKKLRFVAGVGDPAGEGTACVMSAAYAAWRLQRGEEIGRATDSLDCCCPVARKLAIAINDRMNDEEERKKWALKLIPRLIDSKGDRDLTVRRGFLCADRAVRVFAPDRLRKRGFDDDAKKLEALAPITDRETALVAKKAAAAYAAASAAADAAYAAAADAAAAAADAARDKALAEYAEAVVHILVEMKAPGCQWLPLTEVA